MLTVSSRDVWIVWGVSALSLMLLATLWRHMIAISVHEDLARAEGINVQRTELLFTLLIAFVVAISMKIVGLLLITALTVMPAAAAAAPCLHAETMALLSSAMAAVAVIAGLFMSAAWGTVAWAIHRAVRRSALCLDLAARTTQLGARGST